MKLNCGRDDATLYKIQQRWHPWFAWRRVRVGPRDCRWLEVVRRKGKYHSGPGWGFWTWEYRAID